MQESNFEVLNNDVDTLVKDAQELFHAAAAMTGEKADELRNRGIRLLDAARAKGREVQAGALSCGKEMAASADVYVKENPWRTVAAMAGIGLALGIVLARK